MKRAKTFLFVLPFVFGCLSVPSTTAPQSASQQQQRDKEDVVKLVADLVLVDAQVMQKTTGRVVGGLKAEDFVLHEDGVKQQITHFSVDRLPLSVILLVDRGGCLDPYNEKVHQGALEALGRLKPEDEVALMSFADSVELLQRFRYDKKTVADALTHLPPHDENADHCFNRAFYDAADYMRKAANPDGRRVIIMLTALTKSFDCEGPSGEEAKMVVFESGSVVCGLIPSSAEQRLESGAMRGATILGGIVGKRSTSLKDLAEETGGEVVDAKPETLDTAFNTLIDHLRTRYSLGFVSTNTKRDGAFRKLKLAVSPTVEKREGQVVVKTRRGYIAPRVP
jgi:VWFA-related protein